MAVENLPVLHAQPGIGVPIIIFICPDNQDAIIHMSANRLGGADPAAITVRIKSSAEADAELQKAPKDARLVGNDEYPMIAGKTLVPGMMVEVASDTGQVAFHIWGRLIDRNA